MIHNFLYPDKRVKDLPDIPDWEKEVKVKCSICGEYEIKRLVQLRGKDWRPERFVCSLCKGVKQNDEICFKAEIRG